MHRKQSSSQLHVPAVLRMCVHVKGLLGKQRKFPIKMQLETHSCYPA